MEWWGWTLVTLGAPALLGVGRWLVRAIAGAVVDDLDERLGLDDVRANVNPGPTGWPNGSEDLPASIREVYRRQSETHRKASELEAKVDDVLHQLERLITNSPNT